MRITVYDNQPAMLNALRAIFTNMEHAGIFYTSMADQFTYSLLTDKPDLIFIDPSSMTEADLKKIHIIRKCNEHLKIIIFSSEENRFYFTHGKKIKAEAFISKNAAPEVILKTLLEVLKGTRQIEMLSEIEMKDRSDESLLGSMTYREMQVLRRLENGKRVKTISAELKLSPKTVSTYKRGIMNKMRKYGMHTFADYFRLKPV